MHIKKIKRIFSSALLLTAFSCPLYAGDIFEITTKNLQNPNAASQIMNFMFSDGNMKMTDNNDTDMIFNGAAGNMTVISHADKSYMVLDKNFASSIKSQIDAAMANVPPAQRAMMENMMKQQFAQMQNNQNSAMSQFNSEIKRTSRTDTINGYDCVYYESYNNDKKNNELCVATWDDVGAGENIQNSLTSMSEFMEDMLSQFQGMVPFSMNNNPFAQMREMDGFPVLTRRFEGNNVIEETMLSSVSEKAIDSSEFQTPAGYTKREMNQ